MLRHSPPLPLIIDYDGRWLLTANNEEGALLSLQRHDRVRRIHLCAANCDTLDKLFAAMDGPFPLLDHLELGIEHSDPFWDDWDDGECERLDVSRLPESFRAPRLRHLDLNGVGNITEVGLPLLAPLTNVIHLALVILPVSKHLRLTPDYLASCLSLIPQLKHLDLIFEPYTLTDDAMQPINPSNVKLVSLPNLTGFFFHGVSFYLEALAAQITAPHITTFNATFLDRPSSTLPHLWGLITTAAGLRFPVARIKFASICSHDPNLSNVTISMASSEQTLGRRQLFPTFKMGFPSESLYTQVGSTGLICAMLTPIHSAVERLYLCFKGLCFTSPRDYHIENAKWHDLLRPFCKVKKLHVDTQLWGLSRALSPNDNGPLMEILPELRKILRPDGPRFRATFDEFIAARRDAGQHIVKRWYDPVPCLDSEGEEDEDEDESESESDEEVEDEQEDSEGEVELWFEDERGEVEETSYNADSKSDIDYGIDDDPGILTETDSDSDFDSESKS